MTRQGTADFHLVCGTFAGTFNPSRLDADGTLVLEAGLRPTFVSDLASEHLVAMVVHTRLRSNGISIVGAKELATVNNPAGLAPYPSLPFTTYSIHRDRFELRSNSPSKPSGCFQIFGHKRD